MMNHQTKKSNKFATISFVLKLVAGLVFVFFIISRIWYLVSGPPLTIEKPMNGSVLPAGITLLQGKAPTSTNAWVSGISVPVDTNGIFTYDIYVSKGLTKIPVVVKNRYGTSSTKEVVVWGE